MLAIARGGACIYETLCLLCAPAPQDGGTPLLLACQNGRLEMVEALLAKGADVQAQNKVRTAHHACLRPLSVSRTHAYAECMNVPLPPLLSLKLETAGRLGSQA